jgi:hypothetical protein
VITKPRERGGHSPLWAAEPEIKKYIVCTRIDYKIVSETNLNKYLHYVELNNIYINIGVNNGSEKL